MKRISNKVLFIFTFLLAVLISPKVYAEEFNDFDIISPSEILLVQEPKTIEEFERVFLFMSVTDTYEFSIPYSYYDESITSNVMEAFQLVHLKYPEYFSHLTGFEYSTGQELRATILVLRLGLDNSINEQLIEYKKTFFNEAKKTIDDLKDNNIITDDMSDYDKAKKIYNWITINTAYDESFAPISQSGYAVMVNKTAVCYGYTAANNLMLKMLGIKDVVGIYGESKKDLHIWTRTNLDGNIVYIDTTWGDPIPDKKGYCDFKYFAVTREFLSQEHKNGANITWKETY